MANGNAMSGNAKASAAEEKAAKAQGFGSAAEMYAARIAAQRRGKRGNASGTVGTVSKPAPPPKKKQGFFERLVSPATDAMNR